MNKGLFGFAMFVAGVGIGVAATWQYTKVKYEKIAQEEIDSVKEAFAHREEKRQKEEKKAEEKVYEDIVNYYSKENIKTSVNEVVDKVKEDIKNKPYVISPDAFGELDYEVVSLTYYADKILADDFDEIVEDVNNTVGYDSLTTFGDYEEDTVFVRNDRLECDYEILRDNRKYTEVTDRDI